MSDGAFLTGLRVFRARRHEFLEPRRTRRRTIVCGSVAVIVGAATIVSDGLTGWLGTPLPQTIVTAVAFAAAIGCFAALFFRTARKLQPQRWQPYPGGWRRHERIGQQFAARPPELLPEDRDEVLARATDTVEPAIASADRVRWIPFGWVAVWIGALASGLASTESLVVLLMPPVFLFLQGGSVVATVVWLGRAELTRRRVEATPPWTPPAGPAARGADPRGSKLGLPGD
jgi:hypothetical protein